MVVVASRRNKKAIEDVVEAGRCTCNDADPILWSALLCHCDRDEATRNTWRVISSIEAATSQTV